MSDMQEQSTPTLGTNNEIKLDIGSGGKSPDDTFIGVDPYAEGAPVKAFMWELPYEDDTVDMIHAAQSLEHIPKKMIIPTLREFHRVLKPEAGLWIQVPDLVWSCIHWVSAQTTDWSLDVIYGNQRHDGEFHLTGYSKEILEHYIKIVGGYTIISSDYFGSSLEEAQNWKRVKAEGREITQRCIDLRAAKTGKLNSLEETYADVWQGTSNV